MRRQRCTALSTLILSSAYFAAGCSSEDGQEPGESNSGGSGFYDVPVIDAGPIPPPFAYSGVKDPWPANTAEACKAYTSAESATNPYPDTRNCACDTCLDLMHQCDALQSCREIRQCGLDKGCATPNACYLAPVPGPKDPEGKGCVTVIDKWGNTGLGTYLSRKLGECTMTCPRP